MSFYVNPEAGIRLCVSRIFLKGFWSRDFWEELELGFLSSSVSYLYSTVKNLLLLLYCKICYFLRKPKVILTLIVFIFYRFFLWRSRSAVVGICSEPEISKMGSSGNLVFLVI